MRIKKKDVLLESLLIDVTTEFSDVEKRLLKSLNKKYGNPLDSESKFNEWEVAVWLIETLELPYDIAYEITKTYYWNYDKLFSDAGKVRKRIPISEIFFGNISKLMDTYKDVHGEEYGSITLKLDGDTFETNRNVSVWGRSRGFSLYIPFSTWSHPTTGEMFSTNELRNRLIFVEVEFKPITLRGTLSDIWLSHEQYKDDIDNENFYVSVDYTVGEREGDSNKQKLMEFNMPYPKPLTKENFNDLLKNIIDLILEKLNSTKIKLPSGIDPI